MQAESRDERSGDHEMSNSSKPANKGLSFADHTKIILFMITHSIELSWPEMGRSPVYTLRRASRIATSGNDARLFERAAVEVTEYLADVHDIDTEDPLWREAVPIMAKVLLAGSGGAAEILGVLKPIVSNVDGPLKIGVETAVGILEDGFDTIYNPEFTLSIMLPPIIEQILGGMFDQAVGELKLLGDIASNDAAGAIGGAITGGIKGGVTGGTAGAAAGAARGAARGAIVGSLTGGSGTAA